MNRKDVSNGRKMISVVDAPLNPNKQTNVNKISWLSLVRSAADAPPAVRLQIPMQTSYVSGHDNEIVLHGTAYPWQWCRGTGLQSTSEWR